MRILKLSHYIFIFSTTFSTHLLATQSSKTPSFLEGSGKFTQKKVSPQNNAEVTHKLFMDWIVNNVGMSKEMYPFLTNLGYFEKNELLTQDDEEIENLFLSYNMPLDQNKKLKKYVQENRDATIVEELEEGNRRFQEKFQRRYIQKKQRRLQELENTQGSPLNINGEEDCETIKEGYPTFPFLEGSGKLTQKKVSPQNNAMEWQHTPPKAFCYTYDDGDAPMDCGNNLSTTHTIGFEAQTNKNDNSTKESVNEMKISLAKRNQENIQKENSYQKLPQKSNGQVEPGKRSDTPLPTVQSTPQWIFPISMGLCLCLTQWLLYKKKKRRKS